MSGFNTIIFPVKDLEQSKKVFGALLGVAPVADAPYYVGWRINGQDIGLDPNGHANGMTGPLAYYEVADIKATLQQLNAAGAQTLQDATDVGGGKLIATVKDTDGNVIGLAQNS